MDRYTDKRVLITGGGSGIGQACVLRILAEGGTVVTGDVNSDGLAQTVVRAEAEGLGGRLTVIDLDISNEQQVNEVVGRAVTDLGGLDVLVNAAGILRGAHTHECELDLWNQVINVNLTGTFLMVKAALPSLIESGSGVIINFGSTAASFAHPYLAAYAASKGGIEAMTHALASEYSTHGLRAVCVSPGGIQSGITEATPGLLPADTDWSKFTRAMAILPLGMGAPENVASVVAMLGSDDGAFITGTEIRIDGGAHA